MKTYTGMTAIAVAAMVLADGVVDAAEVTALRQYIYADGKISADEFWLVTLINNHIDATPDAGHDTTGFAQLYVDVTTAYVLEDETTPGEVSETEAETLMQAWDANSDFGANERAAATQIVRRATSMPDKFRTSMAARGVTTNRAAAA
ncbi:MAG: hypothetical protein HY457_03140 [Parcubacteria group bacterium]|nr:hypothetical protein [Parcubacteria group bacterium]